MGRRREVHAPSLARDDESSAPGGPSSCPPRALSVPPACPQQMKSWPIRGDSLRPVAGSVRRETLVGTPKGPVPCGAGPLVVEVAGIEPAS
ncbi:putative protein without homology [Propionibacterium freudenreichii subsp. shermanii]|nr:putative protein without homology [Propionibacterium freudenreichii subsp. shermanii]